MSEEQEALRLLCGQYIIKFLKANCGDIELSLYILMDVLASGLCTHKNMTGKDMSEEILTEIKILLEREK